MLYLKPTLMHKRWHILCFLLLTVLYLPHLAAQEVSYDESLYDALEWRNIGPFRGGRSAAVTGVPGKPDLYYAGAAGGGVWRTEDGGQTWENISDGHLVAPLARWPSPNPIPTSSTSVVAK